MPPKPGCQRKVYPRVCGGTRSMNVVKCPPPRSIPACAGEPQRGSQNPMTRRVYPRVCGGTDDGNAGPGDSEGLSPRVRGNRTRLRLIACSAWRNRSIPACAGEPPGNYLPLLSLDETGLSPRVRGNPGKYCHCHRRRCGLSPRVRGNPRHAGPGIRCRSKRSIPACAGEPPHESRLPPKQTVYPRVCGGTTPRRRSCCPSGGLSPRVRGNLGENRRV